jgi:type IV pilus assembly protein PilO
MTAGDFMAAEDGQASDVGPAYPTVFGLQLTPPVRSLAIVLLGVAASFALYNFLVRPIRQQITTVQGQVNEVQAQVDQQRASLQNMADLQAQLDQAIQQRVEVYGLLGTTTSLDTLLIDIHQQIQNTNAAMDEALRSELLQFTPTEVTLWAAAPPELVGKLNAQSVEISMKALFPQTLNILRNLERLEPLIVVRNLSQEQGDEDEEAVPGLSRPLNTTFTLEVLVPAIDPTVPPEPPPEVEAGAEGAPPPEGG